MRDEAEMMRAKQYQVRRKMDEKGITLRQLADKSGIRLPTVGSYFAPEGGGRIASVIPMCAMYMILEKRALPTELIGLLLPDGMAILEVPEAMDHNDIADGFTQYLATKNAAHHPNSPAGVDISDCEDRALRSLAVVGSK